MAYTNQHDGWWVEGGAGASWVGEAELGNVLNVRTDSEFHMASNSLTRLQADQTNEYELKPSQLGVFTSRVHRFIKTAQKELATCDHFG